MRLDFKNVFIRIQNVVDTYAYYVYNVLKLIFLTS